MTTRTMGVAGLLALGGLAVMAVIATNPFSTQASTTETLETQQVPETLSAGVVTQSQIAQPDQLGQLQATDADAETTKPFIGVSIFPVGDGSVKVGQVLEGSPSDGVLMAGDLITAVDGVVLSGAGDLIDAIAAAGSGTKIALTITRDGSPQTVDITVGEREVTIDSRRIYRSSKLHPVLPGLSALGGGLFGMLPTLEDGFVSAEMVIRDENGDFVTYRAVTGTMSSIDAAAGTFTLSPEDGSDPIDYTTNDDTIVNMSRGGDLGPLNTEDDTLVVDIDGEVKLVQQGDVTGPMGGMFNRGPGRGPAGLGKFIEGFGGRGHVGDPDKDLWGVLEDKVIWGNFDDPKELFEMFESMECKAEEGESEGGGKYTRVECRSEEGGM